MALWGKEHNKSRLCMPVRVGVTRNTIGLGHLNNGSRPTLHTTLSAPRNVVKTPQGLKLVPAKRNILGQCLANSPSCRVGLSSQAKDPIPRKIPRPIHNTRVKALMVAHANQNLNTASNLRPQTSSPLVPLEEYEKHHQSRANIGIFNDFEQFRTLPEPHTAQVPFIPSGTPFAEGESIVRPAKRKSNSSSKYKKKSTSEHAGVKKGSEVLHKPSRLGQTLIPISVPKSPHIQYSRHTGTRKDPLKTSTLGLTRATNIKEHGNFFSSKSSMLDIPSVYKMNSNILSLTYKHESALQPPDSQLGQKNETLISPIEQLCGNNANKLPHLGNVMKDDQQCKVSLINNAEACSSFVPKILKDGRPIESQTTQQRSCDFHGVYSCVYPVVEMEQKHMSLLQEQYDLQKQQADLQKQLSDIQQKQTNCLKKMIELQEETIKCLHAQGARPTQVKSNNVEVIPVTPIPEIILTKSPAPFRRRRSARLAEQSKEEESQFIATTNGDFHTQPSLTKDTDSTGTKNGFQITRNSVTKRQDTRRKSVVSYYGGLRSSFKDLLQTPKETPAPGKSAKKVQFTVQDTPARLSSNVMKQLNCLYDS